MTATDRAVGRRFVFPAALASSCFYALGTGVINPLLPLYTLALGGSVAVVAIYQISGTAANALWRPFSGRLGDRYRRPPLILVGLCVSVGAAILILISNQAWMLIPAGVLIGLAAATYWPSLKATAIDVSGRPPEWTFGRLISTSEFGMTSGQLLSGVFLAFLTIRAGISVAVGSLVMAALCAVFIVRCTRRRGDSTVTEIKVESARAGVARNGISDQPEPAGATRQGDPASSLPTAAAGGVLLLAGAAVGAFLPFLTLYVIDELGAPVVIVGAVFAFFSAARFAAGWFAQIILGWYQRVTIPRVRIPMLLVLAALTFASQSIVNLAWFVLLGGVAAILLTLTNVSVMSSITKSAGGRLAGQIGLLESCALAGAMLGPVIGASIYGTRPVLLFPVCGLLLLVGSAVSFFMLAGDIQ